MYFLELLSAKNILQIVCVFCYRRYYRFIIVRIILSAACLSSNLDRTNLTFSMEISYCRIDVLTGWNFVKFALRVFKNSLYFTLFVCIVCAKNNWIFDGNLCSRIRFFWCLVHEINNFSWKFGGKMLEYVCIKDKLLSNVVDFRLAIFYYFFLCLTVDGDVE